MFGLFFSIIKLIETFKQLIIQNKNKIVQYNTILIGRAFKVCFYFYLNFTPDFMTLNSHLMSLLYKLNICLLSIFKAFLPNSKANPNVKAKKKINIITKPYIPFPYALTTYG
jgi:hypothetical protein